MNTTSHSPDQTLTDFQLSILKQSLDWIAPEGTGFARRFYAELYKIFPEIRFFLDEQNTYQFHERLQSSIRLIIYNLEHPDQLNIILQVIDDTHLPSGLSQAYCARFTDSFLTVLSTYCEDAWSPVMEQAWKQAVEQVRKHVLKEPEEPLNRKISSHSADGNGKGGRDVKRLLVVDDDPKIQHALWTFFGSHGFQCHTAENGQLALDFLSLLPIDLVVTDNKMPVLSGLEFLQRLAQDPHRARPPIILLTGNLERSLIKKARQAGVCAILGKPYTGEKLLSAVNQALNERPAHEDDNPQRKL